jgi:hypothetical protein
MFHLSKVAPDENSDRDDVPPRGGRRATIRTALRNVHNGAVAESFHQAGKPAQALSIWNQRSPVFVT